MPCEEFGAVGFDLGINLSGRHRRMGMRLNGGILTISGGCVHLRTLLRTRGADGIGEIFDVRDHRSAFRRIEIQKVADDLALLGIESVAPRISIDLRINIALIHRLFTSAQPLLGDVELRAEELDERVGRGNNTSLIRCYGGASRSKHFSKRRLRHLRHQALADGFDAFVKPV